MLTKMESKEEISEFEVLGETSSVLNMLSVRTDDAAGWSWPVGN